ncbi:ModD protein [Teredinibacter haidensis]|uniref:ModD protein n=1 Tax=Teredinibacter haidensis TaxID=2731755 RepID=UPI00094896D9|nr:ModD protein [Teredinibacter haidensis]
MTQEIVLDDQQLQALLREDVPMGDLTTSALQLETKQGRIEFSARYDTCCCAVEEVARLLSLKGLSVELYHHSGSWITAGTLLLSATGSTATALACWKICQNLLEWSGGIATASYQLVTAVHQSNPNAHVACTRKNTPGTKRMSVKAVRCGGATIHRLGLSESVLIFAEHCQFTPATPEQLVARAKTYCPDLNTTVEVSSIEAALIWAKSGVDILQLEKFSPDKLFQCRLQLAEQGKVPLIAAAGGVNLENAAEYATCGADLLVSSWPYQARPKDIQVRFYPHGNVDV